MVTSLCSNNSDFLFDFYIVSDNALPRVACYDDGCHLVRFVHKNVGKLITDTPASNTLKNTKFYIDKAHWKNHVGTWCKANMSPYANSGKMTLS